MRPSSDEEAQLSLTASPAPATSSAPHSPDAAANPVIPAQAGTTEEERDRKEEERITPKFSRWCRVKRVKRTFERLTVAQSGAGPNKAGSAPMPGTPSQPDAHTERKRKLRSAINALDSYVPDAPSSSRQALAERLSELRDYIEQEDDERVRVYLQDLHHARATAIRALRVRSVASRARSTGSALLSLRCLSHADRSLPQTPQEDAPMERLKTAAIVVLLLALAG